jgi:homoserine kinase type II
MASDPTDEIREVLSHYDLGTLIDFERDQRGTVNVSYAIRTRKDGRTHEYFLRRYKSGIKHDEILFEHSLIGHLVDHSLCPVARLHRTRAGSTFYARPGTQGGQNARYYAIFDFIHGEDRYTWIDPHCSPEELEHAGELLAKYHAAVSSLVCEGMRAEKKIVDLLGEVAIAWDQSPGNSKGTSFDRFLAENFELVRHTISETRAALDAHDVRSLPEVVIHSDFHPGNLVFDGEEICGLVDFDWSKVDLRAFDVALAVWYFATSWDDAHDGELRLDDARKFLEAYQQTLVSTSTYPALSSKELAALPHLIDAANLYVLYWGVRDFLARDVDPEEYLVYLRHGIDFIRWSQADAKRRAFLAILAGLPVA